MEAMRAAGTTAHSGSGDGSEGTLRRVTGRKGLPASVRLSTACASKEWEVCEAEPLSQCGVFIMRIVEQTGAQPFSAMRFAHDTTVVVRDGGLGKTCFATVTTVVVAVDVGLCADTIIFGEDGCTTLPSFEPLFGKGVQQRVLPAYSPDAWKAGFIPLYRQIVVAGASLPACRSGKVLLARDSYAELFERKVRWLAFHAYEVTGQGTARIQTRCTMWGSE
jgi:hypothetical protein